MKRWVSQNEYCIHFSSIVSYKNHKFGFFLIGVHTVQVYEYDVSLSRRLFSQPALRVCSVQKWRLHITPNRFICVRINKPR